MKIVDNAMLINDDCLKYSKNLQEQPDFIFIDPIFRNLYIGKYAAYLETIFNTATKIIKPNGFIISVNNEDEQSYITWLIKSKNLNEIFKMTIQRQSRYGNKYAGNPIQISVYSSRPVIREEFNITDRRHRARGQNGMSMPEWEVDYVFSFLRNKIGKLNNLFCYDMFGGFGTIPIITNRRKIRCISTELDETYYNLMIQNVSKEIKTTNLTLANYAVETANLAQEEFNKKCIICNNKRSSLHFCANHYQAHRDFPSTQKYIEDSYFMDLC